MANPSHIQQCHNNKESHSSGYWRHAQKRECTLTKPPGCPINHAYRGGSGNLNKGDK